MSRTFLFVLFVFFFFFFFGIVLTFVTCRSGPYGMSCARASLEWIGTTPTLHGTTWTALLTIRLTLLSLPFFLQTLLSLVSGMIYAYFIDFLDYLGSF
jgi:ABC-type antimicrobial peptide transport system permease subunit